MSTTTDLMQKVAPAKARANAVAATKKPGTMLDIIRSKGFQAQMALALPKTMTAERLTRIVMTECRKTPALMNCNQESFFGAVLQCAQLGLEPGSALGHCYLVPFGNGKAKDGRPNCQLIIGYRGMIDLARRFEDYGVEAFLYTDISRDGMLSGVNVEATAALARAVNVPVIASGGMHTIEDVAALLKVEDDGVMGAILGRSLYEGTIDFEKALELVAQSRS